VITVARDTARIIFDEVQRWVEQGLRQGGSALESIVYPLSALVPAGDPRCPLEPMSLADLRQVVVADAAVPPDEVKDFSPANCHFSAEDMAAANARFNAAIDALVARGPRLAVNSKLHSHPFSASPFLSGGDLHHGVTSPKAVRWRQRRGLSTAILHVVYPDGDPVLDARPWRLEPSGAVSGAGRRKIRWRVRSWGSSAGDEMVDLGDAKLAPLRHSLVRAARRPTYWTTARGARWCDAQKAALRGAGHALVSRNLLGRGWRRYLVGNGRRVILIALAPDLPRVAPRVLEVLDAATDRFAPLPLPRRYARPVSLGALSLPDLAAHYLGASRG